MAIFRAKCDLVYGEKGKMEVLRKSKLDCTVGRPDMPSRGLDWWRCGYLRGGVYILRQATTTSWMSDYLSLLAQHQQYRSHNGARHEDMHHSLSEDGLHGMVTSVPRLHRLLQIDHSRSSIPGHIRQIDRSSARSLRPRSTKCHR